MFISAALFAAFLGSVVAHVSEPSSCATWVKTDLKTNVVTEVKPGYKTISRIDVETDYETLCKTDVKTDLKTYTSCAPGAPCHSHPTPTTTPCHHSWTPTPCASKSHECSKQESWTPTPCASKPHECSKPSKPCAFPTGEAHFSNYYSYSWTIRQITTFSTVPTPAPITKTERAPAPVTNAPIPEYNSVIASRAPASTAVKLDCEHSLDILMSSVPEQYQGFKSFCDDHAQLRGCRPSLEPDAEKIISHAYEAMAHWANYSEIAITAVKQQCGSKADEKLPPLIGLEQQWPAKWNDFVNKHPICENGTPTSTVIISPPLTAKPGPSKAPEGGKNHNQCHGGQCESNHGKNGSYAKPGPPEFEGGSSKVNGWTSAAAAVAGVFVSLVIL